MAEVLEFNEIEQTEQLCLAWESAFRNTPSPSFFQTLEWLVEFWKAKSPDCLMRLLAIRSHDRFLGFVPLCVEERNGLRCLSFPGVPGLGQSGPVGRDQAAILMLAMQHIARTRRDWELVDFHTYGLQLPQAHRVARAMRIAGMYPKSVSTPGDVLLHLEGATVDSNQIDRQLQFFRTRVESVAYGGGETDREWLEEAAALMRQGDMSDSIIDRCHDHAAKKGMVDICYARRDDQIVGVAYNYHYEGNVINLRFGIKPTVDAEEIGKQLLQMMVSDGASRGDRTLSLEHAVLQQFGGGIDTLPATTQKHLHLRYAPIASLKYHVTAVRNWASKVHQWPQRLLHSSRAIGNRLKRA